MSTTVPRPYQRAGVRLIQHFGGRALVADEMGLGKSFMSLLWAWKYLPEDPPGPVIVVCPATIKINWKREASKHLDMRAEILYGQCVPADTMPPHNPNQVYIVNYDILDQPRPRHSGPDPDRSWCEYLARLKPRLVIGDEIQYIKNPLSRRSKAFRVLAAAAPHLLLMSGTPLANNVADLWPALNLIDPETYPSRFEFCWEFSEPVRRRGEWHFYGARNLDVLHERLKATCMVRRLKRDVLDQLPALTQTVVPIEIDRGVYDAAESEFQRWADEEAGKLPPEAARNQRFKRAGALLKTAVSLKMKGVLRWLADYRANSTDKLLIGAIHYAVTGQLMAQAGRAGVLVDGRMTDVQKQAGFDRFNTDPGCTDLVGNMQAAGVGWSCRSTSTAVVTELPWRPDDLMQFINRIHGLERGLPGVAANAYYLVAAGTVEEDLCRVLQTKQGWADQAIDGVAAGLNPNLDIYDQVREMMKERVRRRER